MRYKLLIFGLLAILALSSVANAEWYENPYFKTYFNVTINRQIFETLPTNRIAYYLPDSNPKEMLVAMESPTSWGTQASTVLMIYPAGVPGAGESLEYSCSGSSIKSVDLSGSPGWYSGYPAWIQFPLDDGFDDDYTLSGAVSADGDVFDERDNIIMSKHCYFEAVNQDLILSFQLIPETDVSISPAFETPYNALEETVDNTYNAVMSLFEFLQMIFPVIALVLIIFFIVFLWKFFEYFVNRIKPKEGEEFR